MSVDIHVKNMKIRCCVAYGCQENSRVEKKKDFWDFILFLPGTQAQVLFYSLMEIFGQDPILFLGILENRIIMENYSRIFSQDSLI